MKVSIIQSNITDDKPSNLKRTVDLVRQAAAADRPDLIILPELSAAMSGDSEKKRLGSEIITGAFSRTFADLASELSVNINLGSFVEQRDDKFYNTSVLFGRKGEALGQYSKIHRFDAIFPDGGQAKESALISAGSNVVVSTVDQTKVGFAICYDLRFGELFRLLAAAGAQLIILPSAFIQPTGMDHWEVLVRARAIETQCYVAAPNQIGPIDGGKVTMFGHSMIVDPWGLVIAQMSNQEGFVSATINLEYLNGLRQRMPIHNHRVLV